MADPGREALKLAKAAEALAYAPGISGQALVIQHQPRASLEFLPVQPLFQGTGAMSFWVMPQSWIPRGQADSRGLIVLLRAPLAKGALIIERQGFDAATGRRDYLLVLLNKVFEPMPMVIADTTDAWPNGVWQLVAVNWDPSGFAVSVNGREWKRTAYPRPLADADFGGAPGFAIGGGDASPAEATLLDEFTLYRRPLTQAEIQHLYKAGLGAAAAPPATPPPAPPLPAGAADSPGTPWTPSIVRTEARLPFLRPDEVPATDGVIHEEEWSGALKQIGGYRSELHQEARACTYYVASDGHVIHVAVRSELPPTGKLLAFSPPQADNDVPKITNEDTVEVWLMPDQPAGGRLYALIVNAQGAVYDFAYDPRTQQVDATWRSQVTFAGSLTGGEWHAELAVPAAALGRDAVGENVPYGLRIVRNFRQPSRQVDWTPVTGAFNNPDTLGTVTWDNRAPLVRYATALSADKRNVELAFDLVNRGPRDLDLVVDHYWERSGNTDFSAKQTTALAAGTTRRVTLTRDTPVGGQYSVYFNVRAPNDATNYFARKFIWQTERGNAAWTVDGLTPDALFKYGYYPSFNRIRTKIDLSNLATRDAVTGAVARLSDASGKRVAEVPYPAFRGDIAEFDFAIPDLAEGTYRLEASALARDGSRTPIATRTFHRGKFDWEGNTLGISDAVIPPFTPIEVSGRHVRTVLRNHELNDIGLPEQIESDGVKILAAPISLNVEVDGRREPVQADQPLAITRQAGHEVRYATTWKAGALTGRLEVFVDYDGMLKYQMDLALPEPHELTRCDLVIPVSTPTARFLHVLSDTGRAAFTDTIPRGENPVWESLFIDHYAAIDDDGNPWHLPGTFVPYAWIGDETRGISWFANSDRDWLPDDRQSAVMVNRHEDRAEIVVRFATRPGRLKRTHSIVFALQATPTKPMPEQPAPWRSVVWSLPALSNQYNAAIIGSTLQWGGDDYYVFYPRNKDFSLYDLMRATREGRHDADAWSRWARGFDPGIPFVDRLVRSIGIGESIFRSRPETIIPYTDMRGITINEAEFKVFQDEWLIYAYSPRKWPEYDSSVYGYDALVCRSRQDYILWYLAKMLDSGAMDGIYYDVVYPKAIRNTISGNAYRDDHGNLRAACDLFETRELLKRSAVLAWQKRGYNLNVAHMTFTMIAPVLTWAGVILDWESRYGMDDFQDRFRREYIRTVSLGRQVGAIPIACGSIGINGDPARRPWVNRTLAGVLLAHEVKDWAIWGADKLYENTLRTLYAFGYGAPDCAVYNYWQDGYPAVIRGLDTASLLLARNGEALVVVTDYGGGGTGELTLDAAKLRLDPGGRFETPDGQVLPTSPATPAPSN